VSKGLRPCKNLICILQIYLPHVLHLPGPTCKKLNDLRPGAVFKSSAFQPSSQELRQALRQSNPHFAQPPLQNQKLKKPEIESVEFKELSDSSDEEFPDPTALLKSIRLSGAPSNLKGKGKMHVKDTVQKFLIMTYMLSNFVLGYD
jgi:hypothetical protein